MTFPAGITHSESSSPKRRDFASRNDARNSGYGSGPGLKDPNDKIQNSDIAYDKHLDRAARVVGNGPIIKPSGRSHSPEYGYAEHLEHRRSLTLPSPSPGLSLHDIPTASTNDTKIPHKGRELLDHETTLSSIRTHLGLEGEAPIIEEHDEHLYLPWSSVRYILREPLAEFFGTFVMVLFGDSAVAQVLLSAGQTSAPGINGFGNY